MHYDIPILPIYMQALRFTKHLHYTSLPIKAHSISSPWSFVHHLKSHDDLWWDVAHRCHVMLYIPFPPIIFGTNYVDYVSFSCSLESKFCPLHSPTNLLTLLHYLYIYWLTYNMTCTMLGSSYACFTFTTFKSSMTYPSSSYSKFACNTLYSHQNKMRIHIFTQF